MSSIATQAINTFGWLYQLDRLVEECLEASTAGIRFLGSQTSFWHRDDGNEAELITEIADVIIVLEQFETKHALEIKELPQIQGKEKWIREFCTQCTFTAGFAQLYIDELEIDQSPSRAIMGMVIGRASDVKSLLSEARRFFSEEAISRAKQAKENRLKKIIETQEAKNSSSVCSTVTSGSEDSTKQ